MINKKSDTHIHTYFSPDADKDATFKNYIDRAKEIGLKELTFTDHVDFDAAHPLFEKDIDYDLYLDEFNKIDPKGIKINLGVEIGYQTHIKDRIKKFIKKYPFEYVILSVHYIEQKDLYTKEYFQNKTKKEAYQIYFETCLQAINDIDDFDAFGHLDYITRYSEFGMYDYSDYKEIIDEILKALIRKNKTLEINTSGISTENRLYPNMVVINRYIALGGKKLKLGSDSHRVAELGREFKTINI